MTRAAKPAVADPETPDGPEPHVPPIWPYSFLPGPSQIPALEEMTRGVMGRVPTAGENANALNADAVMAFWSLALAPYLAMCAMANASLAIMAAAAKSSAPRAS